jgi:hypothetical protein
MVMDEQQQQRINQAAQQFTDAFVQAQRAAADRGVSAQEMNAQLTQDFFNRVIENLRTQAEDTRQMGQQLASELGRHGVRVVTLRTGGVPESIPKSVTGRERIVEGIEKETMLGRAATLEDVGNMAAFVASERARTMTAATANISCGALVD